MQVCLRLCGWILIQQDENQIWLWIELKIDYHCSEGRKKHPNCALHYNDNQFSILSKARSDFHLAVLESIHITSSKPALCRQKEFVYRLKLST